jgi:hypothetical protein
MLNFPPPPPPSFDSSDDKPPPLLPHSVCPEDLEVELHFIKKKKSRKRVP